MQAVVLLVLSVAALSFCTERVARAGDFSSFVQTKLSQAQEAYSDVGYDCFIIAIDDETGDGNFKFMSAQLQQVIVGKGAYFQRKYSLLTEQDIAALGVAPANIAEFPDGVTGDPKYIYLRNPDYSGDIRRKTPNQGKDEWVVANLMQRNSSPGAIDVVTVFAYGLYSLEESFADLLNNPDVFSVDSWSVDNDRGALKGSVMIDSERCRVEAVFDAKTGSCLESVVFLPDATLTARMTYASDNPHYLHHVFLQGISTDPANPGSTREQYFFRNFSGVPTQTEDFYLSKFGLPEPTFSEKRRFARFVSIVLLATTFSMFWFYAKKRSQLQHTNHRTQFTSSEGD